MTKGGVLGGKSVQSQEPTARRGETEARNEIK